MECNAAHPEGRYLQALLSDRIFNTHIGLVTGLWAWLSEQGMKVRVVCYEGYKAEETPRAFLFGNRRVEVVRVLDRWRGEDHEYVKLDGSDGARYILRYDRSLDEWEIQMMESPPPVTDR